MPDAADAIRAALASGEVRRVLFVRVGRVGELLFCTPAIGAFAQRWPEATIGFAGPPGGIEVLRGLAAIDELLPLPRSGFLARRRAIATLRAGSWDLLVHLGGRGDPAALAREIGARFVHAHADACEHGLHVAQNKQRLLWPLGVPGEAGPLRLVPSEADLAFADRFIAGLGAADGPLVGIQAACHSGGRFRLRQSTVKRRWDPANYAEVARLLVERMGARIVVNAASPTEAREARRIVSPLGAGAAVLDREPLGRLAGLIARLDVLVTVDTGPMHMATALGTPIVLLHGPTDHRQTGPWQPRGPVAVIWKALPCSPCRGQGPPVPCDDNQCLKQITPAEVAAAAENLAINVHPFGLFWVAAAPPPTA